MSGADFARIAIVGAGAVGGWIAARLALSGREVLALTSRGPLDEIRIEERDRSDVARLSQFTGAADLVVLAVKAPVLADAAAAAQPLIGADTLILPMLNGVPWWFMPGEPLISVDPAGRIDAALPFDRVIGCVVHAACSRAGPQHVVVTHSDRLILGEPFGGESRRVRELAALFETAGIRSDASDDVRAAIWYKLWGNATINPLSALTRATADRLLDDAAIRAFMLTAMAELAAIGAAVGCPIAESGEERMAVTARLGRFKPSMLQDVEAGRPLELEALVGAPLEIAGRAEVAAPALRLIYAMTDQLMLSQQLS